MNSARIPLEFINRKAEISWADLAYAFDRQLVSPLLAIQFARQRTATGSYSTSAERQLAESLPNDPISPILHALAESEEFNDPSSAEAKWLYLLLAWLFENRGAFEDPLSMVEEIYADFSYPPELAPFVRYMPMVGPDLGSRAVNEARMYERWEGYLDSAAERFRPTA